MFRSCPSLRERTSETKLYDFGRELLSTSCDYNHGEGTQPEVQYEQPLTRPSGLHQSRARYTMRVVKHGLMLDPRSILPDDVLERDVNEKKRPVRQRLFKQFIWRLMHPAYTTFHDVETVAVVLLVLMFASMAIWAQCAR